MKINVFRGDLSDISAKTATLASTSADLLEKVLKLLEALYGTLHAGVFC